MTKRTVVVLVAVFVLSLMVSGAFAYTPPPGVMSPDEVDFGGATITVVGSLSWGIPEDLDELSEPLDRLVPEAMEKFNIGDIERISVSWGELEEAIMTRVMAGDSTHDIYPLQHQQGYWNLAQQGLLYPVGEFLSDDYYSLLSREQQYGHKMLQLRGQYYSFGSFRGQGAPNSSSLLMQYNKDLIEREGLPDPYELYEADEWTWDAMDQIVRQTTRDTTGDGEIDQWGVTNMANGTWAVVFAFTNDAEHVRLEEGRYNYVFDEPAALEALEQLAEWYPYMHSGGPSTNDEFFEGNIAFDAPMWLAGQRHAAEYMEEERRIVVLPRGPRAEQHRVPTWRYYPIVIPTNAANPEGLVAFGEYIHRYDRPYEGTPAELSTMEHFATRRCYEHWLEACHEMWEGEGVLFLGTPVYSLTGQAAVQIITGERGAGAIAEIKPEAQSYLDELFDQ